MIGEHRRFLANRRRKILYGDMELLDQTFNNGRRFSGRRIALAEQGEEPESDLLKDMLAWWRAAEGLQSRGAFDVADHPKWAPHLHLIKRLSSGVYEYRIAGEEVVLIVGVNERGRLFRLDDDHPGDVVFTRYLDRVSDSRVPHLVVGLMEDTAEIRALRFESLDLPLAVSNEDQTVGWILGAMVRWVPTKEGGYREVS